MQPNQIYAQNNALIANAQQMGNQYQNTYQGDVGQSTADQNSYQQYQQQLAQPGNQLGNVYQTNLGSAEKQLGVNPQNIQSAQNALAATQNTMANLPQAIQQSANGRMVTGAQEANRYATAANNVGSTLASQGNSLNAAQAGMTNAMNIAGQQTGFTGQSQQMQLTALNQVYQNAMAQQQSAQQQLQYYKTLQAQGIGLNEQEQGEVAALESAQAQAAQAAAAAESAAAQMMSAQNQGKLINAQLSGMGSAGNNSKAALQAGMPNLSGYQSPSTGLMSDIDSFLQSLVHLNPTTNFQQLGTNATSLLKQLGI